MKVAWSTLTVAVLALAVLGAPRAANAQPVGKVWRIGYFSGSTREGAAHLVGALESGLRDLGYVEGRSVTFEHRFADGRAERLPDLAAEMVRLKLDVIVATYPPIIALKRSLRV